MNIQRILIVFTACVFIVGCTNNNDEKSTASENNKNLIHVKNQAPITEKKRSAEEIAKHLVELATSIANVNDATALVIGKVAVVGIDVNSEIDRSRVGTIKYSVAESLKHDPYGANAIVIADPDTNVRLKEMAKEIKQGRPVLGVMDELAAIVGRIMPELPADIFEDPVENPTETSDKQLPDNKEQQLDKEQRDQSKHNMENRDNPKVPNVQ
jgi:YhcN/YlaJ family sporulation lipoprotein